MFHLQGVKNRRTLNFDLVNKEKCALGPIGTNFAGGREGRYSLTETWRQNSISYHQFTKVPGKVGNRRGTCGVQLGGASLPGGDQ